MGRVLEFSKSPALSGCSRTASVYKSYAGAKFLAPKSCTARSLSSSATAAASELDASRS